MGSGGGFDFNDPAVRAVLEAGLPLFVGYEATDGSGTPEGLERGVRRITLRSTQTPNLNPVMQDVLWNGAPLVGPLPLDTEVTFTPVLAEGSAESYATADGPRTEQVFYSWFATGEGEVNSFRSLEPVDGKPGDPTTTYQTPTAPERITLWVVARDGRGGVDWALRTVDVGP
ncbi:Serine/threonine protein kinase [Corallococcus soli]